MSANPVQNAGQGPAAVLNVRERPVLYEFLWWSGIAIIAVLLLAAWPLWDRDWFEVLGLKFRYGQTSLTLAVILMMLSLRKVAEDEVAAAFSYGKALIPLGSGLHFVFLPLMQLREGPRSVQQFQAPGEPEKVFKGDDKEPLPFGMVRPIRVVTGRPEKNNKDILNVRMTITLSFVIQWVITNVLEYASNYGSKEEVERQVRDIGEVLLAEIATQYTVESFIDNLPRINAILVRRISQRFKNSGVNIISTRLISPDISHEVSEALAGIPKAQAEASQVEIRAKGERARLTQEGEGKAAAELALFKARAEGQKRIKSDLEISGETVVAAEAVRGLSDKTDVIVVGAEGGMRDVMGLVKGAQSALNPTQSRSTQP